MAAWREESLSLNTALPHFLSQQLTTEISTRHSPHLNFLGEQLVGPVLSMPQAAIAPFSPAPYSAVSGAGEAVALTSRNSNDVLAGKGPDPLEPIPTLLIAMAQPRGEATATRTAA